ncbi:MAG: hypothetical protein RIQ93_2511 [Verrucomicrobiota bacterium]
MVCSLRINPTRWRGTKLLRTYLPLLTDLEMNPFVYPVRLLAALVLLALSSQAAQPKAGSGNRPPPAPDTGWVSAFNGKDLTGWVKVGNERWDIEDGVIHGRGVTKEYGYLRTEKKYKDFHLSLRFKCLQDGNSGVFFHSDFNPGSVQIAQGLQVEIDRVIGHHTGGIYGDGRRWIAWPAPENETVIRPTDWNDLLIKVEGNRYIARLNGVVLVDFTDPAPVSFDGYISLQLHSGGLGDMLFKDIFIRDLSKR